VERSGGVRPGELEVLAIGDLDRSDPHANPLADRRTLVTDNEDDVADACRGKSGQRVDENRRAVHFDEALWNLRHGFSQATAAARHEDDGRRTAGR
jgi:hypothetical protein